MNELLPTPQVMADLLAGMVGQQQDREIAAILATARESLRALAWNRYVTQFQAASRRRHFTARHKSRKGTVHA